ncbi:uncharacterized protein V1516DRAFT_671448 [Lipomyces oligophaga]|uniref:uncharacterized protein n=1 Tax=Lipomyces oligophaga TaxID=45792 RepID=UPI0034CFEE3B
MKFNLLSYQHRIIRPVWNWSSPLRIPVLPRQLSRLNSSMSDSAELDATTANTGAHVPKFRSSKLQAELSRHETQERLRAVPVLQRADPLPLTKKEVPRKNYMRYVWHVKFTRNNTHHTFTVAYIDSANPQSLPREDTLFNMSTGQVAKGSHRSGYEAMYQITLRAIQKVQEINTTGRSIELVLNGHNRNRRGFLQLFRTRETESIRDNIKRVTDGTRLRHGGVRPKKHRRV